MNNTTIDKTPISWNKILESLPDDKRNDVNYTLEISNANIQIYNQIFKCHLLFIKCEVECSYSQFANIVSEESKINIRASSGSIRGSGTLSVTFSKVKIDGMFIVNSASSTIYSYNKNVIDFKGSKNICYAFGKTTVHTLANGGNIILHDESILLTNNYWDYLLNIEAYDNSSILTDGDINNSHYKLYGNASIKKIESSKINNIYDWIRYYGAPVISYDEIIVYKKVSVDYKTQEGTYNETSWLPGTTVEMPMNKWKPDKEECGEGKFHACASIGNCLKFRPLFKNNNNSDRFVAILVNIKDIHLWTNYPSYPEKIAFRKGIVLYECAVHGFKITECQ